MKTVTDHNAARWLEVRYLTEPARPGHIAGLNWRGPGWYVLRTCPCHLELAVTVPLKTERQAESAKAAMLAVSGG